VSGQRAEREAAVKEVAEHGWRFVKENANGYYVMHCYCGKHYTNLHRPLPTRIISSRGLVT
jgi:hypothetical protein